METDEERKERKTGEDSSYLTAQVGRGDKEERRARLENDVATKRLR